jgi:hypothetical protein
MSAGSPVAGSTAAVAAASTAVAVVVTGKTNGCQEKPVLLRQAGFFFYAEFVDLLERPASSS